MDDLKCAQNIVHCGRNVKLIATLLGRLTCHPMRAHHGASRAEFSLTEPIPLQAENRERKTVLEAKYLEQADQWVCNSIYLISKVTVGNPFSRRGGSLCYVNILKKIPC